MELPTMGGGKEKRMSEYIVPIDDLKAIVEGRDIEHDLKILVRCKDCQYYRIHTLFGRSQGWCERLCDEFDRSMARETNEDDFCSRAERREE